MYKALTRPVGLVKLVSVFYQLVWNGKTLFWLYYNLRVYDNKNLISKKLGFYKLLAWPISIVFMVTIYFYFVLDTD